MPWLKWLTLDDLPAFGLSKMWAKGLLPLFYERGYLEIRLIDEDGMDDFDLKMIELLGFNAVTVEFHEFKLTKKKGRKEKFDFSFKNLYPSWEPSHA